MVQLEFKPYVNENITIAPKKAIYNMLTTTYQETLTQQEKEFLRPFNLIYTDQIPTLEINKNILTMLVQTKNNLEERPLFRDYFFIDTSIFYKNISCFGALIMYNKKYETYDFTTLTYLFEDDSVLFKPIWGLLFKERKQEMSYPEDFTTKETKQYNKLYVGLEKEIRNIIINIIDYINNNTEEYQERVFSYSEERNEKRVLKGKHPIKNTVQILPKKEYEEIYRTFSEEKNKYSHSFIVRGHWREYKNKKYLNKKKQWIKPFWKGTGVKIYKNYTIK